MDPISKRFSFNKAENMRNLRDALVVSFGFLTERLLDSIVNYDFGSYEQFISLGAGIFAIILNRYINWLRVNSAGKII